MGGGLTAIAAALGLSAAAGSPIRLDVKATPGLEGAAPFWVELDATGTTTENPSSDWVRDYHITSSDGAETDLGVFEHTYVEPGRYSVTVSARDADGHVASTTLHLLVTTPSGASDARLQLRVDAAPGYRGPAPFWLHLDAARSAVTDPHDWIFSYRWASSDGATGDGPTFDHLFAAPGRYTVEVAAEDLYGRRVSLTRTVHVTPGAPEPRDPGRRRVIRPAQGVAEDPAVAGDPGDSSPSP
ncbi:MAG: PKD domain-containing protein [Myxococcales bacterium]